MSYTTDLIRKFKNESIKHENAMDDSIDSVIKGMEELIKQYEEMLAQGEAPTYKNHIEDLKAAIHILKEHKEYLSSNAEAVHEGKKSERWTDDEYLKFLKAYISNKPDWKTFYNMMPMINDDLKDQGVKTLTVSKLKKFHKELGLAKNEAQMGGWNGKDIDFETCGCGFSVSVTNGDTGYSVYCQGYSNNTSKNLDYVSDVPYDINAPREERKANYDKIMAKIPELIADMKVAADEFDKKIEEIYAKHGFQKAKGDN